MGVRRISCVSYEYTNTEYQEEMRNDRTRLEQKSFLFLICVVCISFVLFIPQWTSAEEERGCLPHCWKKVSPNIRFKNALRLNSVNTIKEQDCKDACFNREMCTAVYFGIHPDFLTNACWLQIAYSDRSVYIRNANYWNLTACSDNCFPYCWKPRWDYFLTEGGILKEDADNENDCKLLCSKDPTCNGVDWHSIDGTCFFMPMANVERKETDVAIYHWEITRNLPINCENGQLPGPTAIGVGQPMTTPAVIGAPAETTSAVPSNANVAAANIPAGAGAVVGESSVVNVSAPGGGALGGPSVGESNLGNVPAPGGGAPGGPSVGESNLGNVAAPAGGPIGVPANTFTTIRECPSYLKGIIAMAAMMGVTVLAVIGLIAYISSIRLDQAQTNKLRSFGNDKHQGYQSIGTVPETTESSEAETK